MRPFNKVPIPDNENDRLYQVAPESVTLVGGQALRWWCDVYGIHQREPGVPLTQDTDFMGPPESLDALSRLWGGQVHRMPEQSLSALFGQIHKAVGQPGQDYINVDVIHRVFGLNKEEVLRQRVKVEKHGHGFYVLHPLHVMEARLENLAGIADKQTSHGAFQTKLGLQVGRAYLVELIQAVQVDPTQERKLLNALNRMAKLACTDRLQGAAKAWGLNILDTFPLDQITHEGFLAHQWPRLKATAEAIPPSATAGGPHARSPHAPRSRRHP